MNKNLVKLAFQLGYKHGLEKFAQPQTDPFGEVMMELSRVTADKLKEGISGLGGLIGSGLGNLWYGTNTRFGLGRHAPWNKNNPTFAWQNRLAAKNMTPKDVIHVAGKNSKSAPAARVSSDKSSSIPSYSADTMKLILRTDPYLYRHIVNADALSGVAPR